MWLFVRILRVLGVFGSVASFHPSRSVAVELLTDPGFEDAIEVGGMDAPWRTFQGDPMPTVNATTAPRSGAEHAVIEWDTAQNIGPFGAVLGSFAFTNFGPLTGITDLTGRTLAVTNHHRLLELNMSGGGGDTPAILLRTYLGYYSDQFGFLGFGGFENDFAKSDLLLTAVTSDYQETSYTTVVPNFGTPVTSVEFTFGPIAPELTAGGVQTGTAKIAFDDMSLILVPPGDYDVDGDVDGNDFLVWQRGGSPAPNSAADLAVWRTNFGFPPPVAAANLTSVPEPATAVLSLAVAGSLVAAWTLRPRACSYGRCLEG
jgi:hypothetical protein